MWCISSCCVAHGKLSHPHTAGHAIEGCSTVLSPVLFVVSSPASYCVARPQVIMQLFHWTRNPSQVSKIAQRKEEIYDSIMNGTQPAEVPGCRGFLDTLRNYNVSVLSVTAGCLIVLNAGHACTHGHCKQGCWRGSSCTSYP